MTLWFIAYQRFAFGDPAALAFALAGDPEARRCLAAAGPVSADLVVTDDHEI
jgi:hypothetical protein